MRKLVIVFGILLVIAASMGVVSAVKPDPVTPDQSDPFAAIWNAIQNLQN